MACFFYGLDQTSIDTSSSVAQPFEEVQKKVNDLLDGRILIGHAVHHDLKVLIVSKFVRLTDVVLGLITFTSYPTNERYSVLRL
jgi:hypothetical protein